MRQHRLVVKRFSEKDTTLPGSDPYPVLKIATEALVWVDKGSSERAAVAQAVAEDRALRKHRREALNLVIGVLTQLDTIDNCVQSALPMRALNRRQLALSRLACHIAPKNLGRSPGFEIVKALRELATGSFRQQLEYLLGVISALGPDQILDGRAEADRVAFRTHHPRWWVEYCFRLFGRSEAIRMLAAGQRPRYVRVNPLRNRGRTGLPSKLKNLQKLLKNVEATPEVFTVSDGGAMSNLAQFYSEGLFQVQDLASFLAVKAAEPSPAEKVLDICAAPGAKTGAMAQLMKNRGRIVSLDYSVPRMKSWRNEMARLGVRIADPVIEDASRPGIVGSFNLVFIDPPCSGTGILDRNPRMKWRLSPQLIERYSHLQTRILEASAKLAGPDGRILYCTCSLTLEENEMVVSGFLRCNPDFETRPILDGLGSPGMLGMRDCRRFYPHRDGTAGYFIARLERQI